MGGIHGLLSATFLKKTWVFKNRALHILKYLPFEEGKLWAVRWWSTTTLQRSNEVFTCPDRQTDLWMVGWWVGWVLSRALAMRTVPSNQSKY
jgi:hypothetical protein